MFLDKVLNYKRQLTLALIFLMLVLVVYFSFAVKQNAALRVSGMLEADQARVGSLVGGRVARVLVSEGSRVNAGDVLLQLEPFDLEDQRDEAQAQLEAARQDLKLLQKGFRSEEIAAARARLQNLSASLDLADKNYKRQKQLFEDSAVSKKEFDEGLKEMQTALAAVNEQKAQLDKLERGQRVEELDRASALVQAAEARLQVVNKHLEELQIRAPMQGVVEAVDLVAGDIISANAPVLTLLALDQVWVRAYLPANKLDLKLGQEVTLIFDSFPEERMHGEVSFVASEAEFTPSNVQTVEDRSKQVYRVKLRVSNAEHKLRPGMYADVIFETR